MINSLRIGLLGQRLGVFLELLINVVKCHLEMLKPVITPTSSISKVLSCLRDVKNYLVILWFAEWIISNTFYLWSFGFLTFFRRKLTHDYIPISNIVRITLKLKRNLDVLVILTAKWTAFKCVWLRCPKSNSSENLPSWPGDSG